MSSAEFMWQEISNIAGVRLVLLGHFASLTTHVDGQAFL